MKFYTVVGSRKTPKDICDLMSQIGIKLESQGWILRSGAAIGADSAFEKYVTNKVIYTIKNFDFSPENYDFCKSELFSILGKGLCFDNYSKNSQILILRDMNQVLGSIKTTLEKSKFLICYTPYENYELNPPNNHCGGTRFAVRIAKKHQIPVYNLVNKQDKERIEKWIMN